MEMRFHYPARFKRDRYKDGRPAIMVAFPDLPEALTCGDDPEDAMAEAEDCLATAIAARISEGAEIPPPSPLKRGQRLIAVPVETAAKAALYLAVRESGMSKAELSRRLGMAPMEVRRLLDPRHPTKLPRLSRALAALGRQIVIETRERAA